MKSIWLLISFIFISCGGSSGGGGGSAYPDTVCGNTKSACGPFSIRQASSLRTINKQKFIELLQATEDKLLDVKVGMTFLRFDRCQLNFGEQSISEEAVIRYTVLGFNKDQREIKSLVEVLVAPKTTNCYQADDFEDKKYISISHIPDSSNISELLDQMFDVYQQGIIDGNPAIVASKKEVQDGYNTKIEFAINLNMPINFGFYFVGSASGSDGVGERQRFNVPQSIVDTTGISENGLPIIYEMF